jgi:hypothetical protein
VRPAVAPCQSAARSASKKQSLVILFFSPADVLAYDRVPEEFIYPVTRKILIATAVLALITPSTIADTFPVSGPVVSGKVARLHSGKAAAPKKAAFAGQTSDLGCKSTSLKALSLRWRSQVV